MVFTFTPSDDTLSDLRGIRAALESRKTLLLRTHDDATRVLIENEIVALRELVMSIAHELWDETRPNRPTEAARAAQP